MNINLTYKYNHTPPTYSHLPHQPTALLLIGRRGWTAIMYAAAKGHLETVIALGKSGANVNAVNTQGRSALMYAAANGIFMTQLYLF